MSLFKRLLHIPSLLFIRFLVFFRCLGLWKRFLALFRWQSKQSLETDAANKQPHNHAGSGKEIMASRPRRVRYEPIPGSWQRKLHPEWPEKRFQIPEHVPYGTVYYVTKGTHIGFGMTARIEKTPAGFVIKTPRKDPYTPGQDEQNLENMRIEAEVYRRLRDCPHVPKMIHWDSESCCLSLEYLERRNLAMYFRGMQPPDFDEKGPPQVDDTMRRRWTVQATKALKALHDVGVIHCDFVPRNLLLDSAFNLYISDFAGSSIDGAAYKICGGPRFTAPFWEFSKSPEKIDDIFSLGSVLYVIMTGMEPYADKDELEVTKLYEEKVFPDVSGIICGQVIQGCWDGTLMKTDQVLEMLTSLYGQ